MAVETTKSRRDKLSMGHLLEKKCAAGAACADGAKTRGVGALFPAKIYCEDGDAITWA